MITTQCGSSSAYCFVPLGRRDSKPRQEGRGRQVLPINSAVLSLVRLPGLLKVIRENHKNSRREAFGILWILLPLPGKGRLLNYMLIPRFRAGRKRGSLEAGCKHITPKTPVGRALRLAGCPLQLHAHVYFINKLATSFPPHLLSSSEFIPASKTRTEEWKSPDLGLPSNILCRAHMPWHRAHSNDHRFLTPRRINSILNKKPISVSIRKVRTKYVCICLCMFHKHLSSIRYTHTYKYKIYISVCVIYNMHMYGFLEAFQCAIIQSDFYLFSLSCCHVS